MESQFPHEPILSGILLKRDTLSRCTGLRETEIFQLPSGKAFPVETILLDPFLMRNDSKSLANISQPASQTRIHFFVITSQVGRRFYVYTLNLHESTLALISTYKFHQTFQKLLVTIAESGMKSINSSFTTFLWKEFSQQDTLLERLRQRPTSRWYPEDFSHKDTRRERVLWIDLRKYEYITCNLSEGIGCTLTENPAPCSPNQTIRLSVEPCIQVNLDKVEFKQESPFLFCDIQSPKSYTLCESDMRILISSLSSMHLVSVIEYIMSENQIIFCSKYLRRLSECMESLLSLIYPFEWPYVYIPLLPSHLFGFLSAPCPYLIGIQHDCTEFLEVADKNAIDGSIIVDLDCDFIYDYVELSNGSPSLAQRFFNNSNITSPNSGDNLSNVSSPHKNNRNSNSLLQFLWYRSIESITEPQKEPPASFGFPHHIRSRLLIDLQKFYIPALTESLYSFKPVQPPVSKKTGPEAVEEHGRKNTWDSSDDDDDPFEQEIAVSLPQEASYVSANLFRRDSIAHGDMILQISHTFLHHVLQYRPSWECTPLCHDEDSDDETCFMPFVAETAPSGIHDLRKTFLKVFLNLFKTYRLYLQNSPDGTDLQFDAERFIRENVIRESFSTHLFYSTFLNTQIFSFFIQTRHALPTYPDIFDEKSSGKMERFAINLSLLAERTHSGFIWKLGQVRHSWKYRYFVLRGNHLTYYKDNVHMKRLKGNVELVPGQSSLYIPRVTEKHKTQYPFVIRTKDRTLLCCVETRQAHNEWNRIIAAKLMNTDQRETIEKSYTKQNLLSMGNTGHNSMNMESAFMLRQEPWLKFMTNMKQEDAL
mmetsp:Transcript_7232/g.27082  ORF Transcript_7232/g.27082 Transcript_7232/m.27082 type:complete len:820 (-) Transcript_7232:70-2529(-)